MPTSIDSIFIVKFLSSILIMNLGSVVISVGYRRLRILIKQDSTNTIAGYFPERSGFNKIYYARWDSQKRFLFIMLSNKWPQIESISNQMNTIRLLCLGGLSIVLAGFVFGTMTLFSLAY